MIAVFLAACLAQDCRADLDTLIDQLGSDSVQERDDACAILRYVGEPALPDLEHAAESGDAEVAGRARGLIAFIAPHRGDVRLEMVHLFAHGCGAFRVNRLESCILYCDGILRIDPGYAPARRLREAAELARREEGARERFLAQVEKWREETREDLVLLPDLRSVRYPSRTSWLGIAKDLRHEVHLYAAFDATDCNQISRKLETMKIDLAFENTKLEDILAFVRDFSGLNIVLDARVADKIDPDKSITFKVKDLVLKNILKLLLAQYGLDYVIKEHVVFLTDRHWVCDPDDF